MVDERVFEAAMVDGDGGEMMMKVAVVMCGASSGSHERSLALACLLSACATALPVAAMSGAPAALPWHACSLPVQQLCVRGPAAWRG
ncbi:hypothetical protein V6N11_074608 [Hibiscus sabdariffa]|uniref:Uncharacterized protein n=1 Tax=Hibiscus sabdariffa TaxID=183260 RepID=A0ABR2R4H7_9ROSI